MPRRTDRQPESISGNGASRYHENAAVNPQLPSAHSPTNRAVVRQHSQDYPKLLASEAVRVNNDPLRGAANPEAAKRLD
jgi:hypothetical protein